ncbi:MAG: DUF2281 domain-containing protein [Caldilineaceae bacterium]
MTVNIQEIYRQIKTLPPDSLEDLAIYLEFLRFKTHKTEAPSIPPKTSLRIVNLRGMLKGYDFSPELLAEARKEMWNKFHSPQ